MRLGTKGLESLPKSFLWEKINATEESHFYDDHPGYGAIMPFGSPPLTYGELEFVLAWIIAGASETGEVADPKLLEKTQWLTGEVYVNLHLAEAQEVKHEAAMLVLGNNEFHLPAGQVTTVTDDFFSDERIHVFQLASEPEPTPWDVNSDGVVNILDLIAVAIDFGKSGVGIKGDVNRDEASTKLSQPI